MARIEADDLKITGNMTLQKILNKMIDWVPQFKNDGSYEVQETRELDGNVLEENKKN